MIKRMAKEIRDALGRILFAFLFIPALAGAQSNQAKLSQYIATLNSCSAATQFVGKDFTCHSGLPGTVTSITAGTGLTGGTITTAGTLAVDQAFSPTWTGTHMFSNAITVNGGGSTLKGGITITTAASGTDATISGVGFYTNANLPSNLASSINLISGSGSPIAGRVIWGDGSGWHLKFAKRSGGVTTDVVDFADSGAVQFIGVSTTASAANAFLDSANSNNLLRSTSSIRYKQDIHPLDVADEVLKLRPIRYRSKAAADDPKLWWYGLIAEEVAKVDQRLIFTDAQGRPDGVQYDRIGVLTLGVVQRQQHELNWLWTVVGLLVVWNLYLTFRRRT